MSTGYRPAGIAALFATWAAALATVVWLMLDHESDPLCAALDELHGMTCHAELPAAATLPPGTLVDGTGQAIGALIGNACLLPGSLAPVIAASDRAAMPATVPRQTYTTLSGVGGSAIPGPRGLFADARRWPGLREVGVELGNLRAIALPALPSNLACQLRVDCGKQLEEREWRLVAGVLAGAVRYRASGSDQQPLAPALAGSGLVPDDGAWALPGPRVVALRFADSATVQALGHCELPVARMHAGTAVARIEGGGQRGAFGADVMRQPLGKVALVSARGSEESDCDPGLGRERSHAYAQALLDSMDDGGLRMAAEVRASSGRYRVGRCPGNGRRLPSNNMLVTRAAAAVQFEGELALLLRAAGPHTLQVDWAEFPAGTRLRVTAPDGSALQDDVLAQPNGSQRFEVSGPGVFRVLPSVATQIEREGESGVKSSSFHAQLHAWAWAPGGEQAAKAAHVPPGRSGNAGAGEDGEAEDAAAEALREADAAPDADADASNDA